jgi:methanogenic corrinoid protein MtbC1
MAEDLVSTLADLKEKEALKIVEDRLSAGEEPLKILDDARRALEIVGERFADSKYFIPDLVYSGEILKEITDMVKPKLAKAAEVKRLGKVACLAGNVPSDLLNLGTPQQVKDYVRNLIDTAGKGGGYVVSNGAFFDQAKAENVKVMVDTAKEYGVYK